MTFLQPIVEWYKSLSQRDQKLVWVGGLLLLLLLLYLAVVQPLTASYDGLSSRIVREKSVLQRIARDAPVLKRLEAQTGGDVGVRTHGPSGSLFSLVSESVQNSPIASSVRQLRRDGAGRVALSFNQVGFDALIRWLSSLVHRHGIVVVRASFNRGSSPGTVNANLDLRQAS